MTEHDLILELGEIQPEDAFQRFALETIKRLLALVPPSPSEVTCELVAEWDSESEHIPVRYLRSGLEVYRVEIPRLKFKAVLSAIGSLLLGQPLSGYSWRFLGLGGQHYPTSIHLSNEFVGGYWLRAAAGQPRS